ncbi:MAG: aldehyde dehydrogenase family protein [Methanomassiliicoccaceae archaeon]|nr:aldehyde dehydrogenase family protein [Methanomassiliicoccaceae archaeon]
MTDQPVIDTATDEDRKFDAALNSVLQMDKRDYPCHVGGLMVASGSEHMVRSPVDESILFGRFQEPEDGLADRAVAVASSAFDRWSITDPKERAEIFGNVLDIFRKQRYRMAAAVTISAGMTRDDALYEADRLIEITEDGIRKMSEGIKGKPIGVWAVLSEYNSPLAAPAGHAVSAILAGNAVVMIPPKECPFPVYMIYDILSQVLPDGVLNLMFDRTGKASSALIGNENVKGIAASGRGDRFEDLMFAAVDEELTFIGEFKGMNPMVVYRPQSMKAAAEFAISSAFGFGGQRMDSCSKVIVTMGERKQFVDHLLVAAGRITVGDPAERETTVGPVISKESMNDFLNMVKENRANLIFGGKRVTGDVTDAGYYVMPAIFAELPDGSELNEMDHSLPILSVQTVADLDEAIEAANDCEFGSSMGIASKDEKAVERFLAAAGSDVVYVNGTSGAVGTAVKASVTGFVRPL